VLVAVSLVAVLVGSHAQGVWLYGLERIVVGLTLPPAGAAAYLLVMESIPEGYRPGVTVLMNVGFSLFLVAMAVVCGTWTRTMSWRGETLLMHCPLLLLLLLGAPLASESPSFLAMRNAKADSIAEAEGPLRQLLEPRLLGRLALTALCWIGASVGYYGLSFCSGSISKNLYLNMGLLASIDIAGYAVPWPLIEWLGSRRTQIVSFLGAALVLLLCGVLPQGSTATIACALVGRLWIDVAFTTCYLLLLEHFPAGCRSSAAGAVNFAARFTSLAAPFFAQLPAQLACFVLGALSLAAAAASCALP